MQHFPPNFRGALWESNHQCAPIIKSRPSLPSLPFYNLLLWVLLGVLTFPCCVRCLIFKVGVLGPWNCDPIYYRALPATAAKLAVGRINGDLSLDLGLKMDFIIFQEPCETSKALTAYIYYENLANAFVGPTNPGYCIAASLLAKTWDKALFSYGCVTYELDRVAAYPTFSTTVPFPTDVLFVVLKHFRWASVAVVSSNEDIWMDAAGRVATALRSKGLPVGLVTSMGISETEVENTMRRIQNAGEVKVIIMCMHSILVGGEQQATFLLKAQEMGVTSGKYVFVPYDTLHYSLPYNNVSYAALQNNSRLREAYDAVLTITVASEPLSFNEAFAAAKRSEEVTSPLQAEQVHPLFGTIYNSIYLLAKSIHNARKAGMQLSGSNLAYFTKNTTFSGFNQKVRVDSGGEMKTNYIVLDSDNRGSQLYQTYLVDLTSGKLRFAGRSIRFPGGSPPPSDSSCWFDKTAICTGGVEVTYIIVVLAVILALAVGGIAISLYIRRRLQQIQLVKGPNRILLNLEDLTFINPQLSKKKITLEDLSESKSALEDKSVDRSHSVNSMQTATHETTNVAVYEGDWVWLKKFEEGHFQEVEQLITMKDLRNENVNPFLGFFLDCSMFAVVTEHCSRGSLEDLLRNEDVKLDWMFKSSLVLDLIKGMKYLHHRDFPHGRLKSRNCVVDGRFVLKITDYGFNELLETQKAPLEEPPPEDLFWTAPEFLRDLAISRKGTYKGDVYSFSIILQEVVVRGPPYCMLGLPPEEIIRKVKKPPPMCRPTVAPDQAPLECIQLMKQCWSELPDRRPCFDEIFDRFKMINKGKKTNIIDSMLRMLEQYSSNLEDLIRERTEELEVEKQRTEKLLSEMLPPSVAEALKTGATVEPEYFDQVTIYFSDIVGFTTISSLSDPIEVVDLLNDLYSLDHVLCHQKCLPYHSTLFVETIGDAYMVASGLPKRNGNKHAAEIANMSLNILSSVGTFHMRHMPDVPVRIRIGIHSGPCVAGVVGLTMPRYCLFGDTVNTASRMESTGLPYRIHVNMSTVNILRSLNEGYKIDVRGKTELKGKGIEETYWLVGKTNFTKPLPKPPEIRPGDNWQEMVTEEIKTLFRKANRPVDSKI
uniref:Guanylate cyclase n=1 Tax=Acanthochromis polyacanthus TaxID=80966 RepID=A0A3Q1GI92_9TELE